MPGFDQKGPSGNGAMTGRQMGKCTNYSKSEKPVENNEINQSIPNQENFTRGRGNGRGFGAGRGRGFGAGANTGAGRGQGRGMGRGNRF